MIRCMGTWDSGPFDNDGASDLVQDARGGPAPAIASALRTCADAPTGTYLDVDDGQPAVAAAELVALGFGYGKLDAVPLEIRRIAITLGPNEELRQLALRALPRILDRKSSELAGLWEHDDHFEKSITDLIQRLEEAGD